MSTKVFSGLIIVLLCSYGQCWSFDKSYQEQWGKRLEDVTQNFLMLNNVGAINRREKLEFPEYKNADIDNFLKTELGDLYVGFHPDIAQYVRYISNRPKFQLQLWHTIVNQFEKEHASRKNNGIAQLIASRLEFPQYSFDESWLIPYIISLGFGNQANDFVDGRLQVYNNYLFRLNYFEELKRQKINPIHALGFCVLGSATITRIPNFAQKNYWELYPDINSEHRDFYTMMLASTFMLNEMKKMQISYFTIEPKNKYISVQSKHNLHLEFLAKNFRFPLDELKLVNRKFYSLVIPVKTNFRLPAQFTQQFIEKEELLALGSAYHIHKIKAPFCLVKYKIKPEDKIDVVAKNFSIGENEIKQINFLGADDWQAQKLLFIRVPLKDSVFYSAFDTLSTEQIKEQLKTIQANNNPDVQNVSPNASSNPVNKTHVVKSGDTLSQIARKYGVTVKQIKTWNNLKSDNIQIGQKLIIKK